MRGLYWSKRRGSFGVRRRLSRGWGLIFSWWLSLALGCVQLFDPVVIVVYRLRRGREPIHSFPFIHSLGSALPGSQFPLGGEESERIITEVFARSLSDESQSVFRFCSPSYRS